MGKNLIRVLYIVDIEYGQIEGSRPDIGLPQMMRLQRLIASSGDAIRDTLLFASPGYSDLAPLRMM